MGHRLHFGVALPQLKRSWEETRTVAAELEALGFDALWLNDHLLGVPMPNVPILEAWTTLAAVGAITRRVELGTLVSPVGFRNPALYAKMVATLDHITGGRVIAGVGAGWFEMEYRGYGFPFPPIGERLAQLDEAIEVMKGVWTEPGFTYRGRYFTTDGVLCYPGPQRAPHPPILIGGSGERVLLRLVAKHADIWNNLAVNCGELEKKVAALRDHCRSLGREPDEVAVSQQILVVIAAGRAEAVSRLEKARAIYGGHFGDIERDGIWGDPEQCRERIERLASIGCRQVVIEFFGRDPREPARLFAEKVMPAFH